MIETLASFGFTLNNRERATLMWLAILLLFSLSRTDVRASLGQTLQSIMSPKVSAVFLVYFAWCASEIWIIDRLGLWRFVMAKDALVWVITAGVALMLSFTAAATSGYFRRRAIEALGIAAILEYWVNLSVFSFWKEVAIQPLILFLALAPIVSKAPSERRMWVRISRPALVLFGLSLIVNTGVDLYRSHDTIDWSLFVLRAALPVWLALGLLPFVFLLALFARYEIAFQKLDRSSRSPATLWVAKLALVFGLHVRLRAVHEASKGGTYHIANASTLKAALQATSRFQEGLREEQRAERKYEANLVRYAGSQEVDQAGR